MSIVTQVLGKALEFEGAPIHLERKAEYNDSIVQVPKYSAVIFPGSLYHQVKEIGKGRRYVIVSFLFTEAEVRLRPDCERFRFMVQRDICDMKINSLMPENDYGS